jgi:hypothetical protein
LWTEDFPFMAWWLWKRLRCRLFIPSCRSICFCFLSCWRHKYRKIIKRPNYLRCKCSDNRLISLFVVYETSILTSQVGCPPVSLRMKIHIYYFVWCKSRYLNSIRQKIYLTKLQNESLPANEQIQVFFHDRAILKLLYIKIRGMTAHTR